MRLKPEQTKNAREALEYIYSSFDMLSKKGRGLGDQEEKVRSYVLREFPNLGRAPKVREIGEALRIPEESVIRILKKLDSLDVIYLNPDTSEIEGAYPFRNSSEHRVSFKNGGTANAMCAIDALGIAFMFRKDIGIDSSCAYCGESVHIEVEGGEITQRKPEDAVVWAGTKCSEHAATSLCTTLAFFCSKEHVEKWRAENKEEGKVLSLAEALYVGKSIFEHFLTGR